MSESRPAAPAAASPPDPAPPAMPPRRGRRWLLWAALVSLLLVAQSLLLALTLSYETQRAQDQVDALALELVGRLQQLGSRQMQDVQALMWEDGAMNWQAEAARLLRVSRPLLRLEWRDAQRQVQRAVDSPFGGPMFARLGRAELQLETELACTAAVRQGSPQFSRSYFCLLYTSDAADEL